MTAAEFNFDGIVGPTHNYAGLARGNIASGANRGRLSHPKMAALQGLAKMQLAARLGTGQGVLPPQERPDMFALRRLGFSGSDEQVLWKAAKRAPELLAACASASAMWAANAATVSPAPDTEDGRLHITPANLMGHLHRSLETQTTGLALRAIFRGELFAHHEALPATPDFSDEGAANHTRLCAQPGGPGVELFAYGFDPGSPPTGAGRRFHGRQSRRASEAIARLHGLKAKRTFFVSQHPEAIDAGVFHNDVIAVGHRHIFLFHEKAFATGQEVIGQMRKALRRHCAVELKAVCVPEALLPLKEAVGTYLFNSQLLSLPDGRVMMLAPAECRRIAAARRAIDFIRERGGIDEAHFVDVKQSMRNGGGPACLRLRVVLDERQRAAMAPDVLLTEALGKKLHRWIERHYREELRPADFADPALLKESRAALDELTRILGLGAVYPFQRG